MFPVAGEGCKRFSLIELFEVGRSILSLNLSRWKDLLLIWATSSASNTLKKKKNIEQEVLAVCLFVLTLTGNLISFTVVNLLLWDFDIY